MTAPGPCDRVELDRARRRFVREHHPDRGGDEGAFAAGLAAFDASRRALDRPVRVTAVARPRGLRRLTAPLLAQLSRRRRPPRVH